MEVTFTHSVYYSNHDPVPIREIAAALVALESIIHRTPRIFEQLVPGTQIQRVDVLVEKMTSGSLTEDFLIKFIFQDQANFDAFVGKLRKLSGMEKLTEVNPLFAVVVLALVVVGAQWAVTTLLGEDAAPDPVIQANNNTIINIGAEMSEMTPAQFEAIIKSAVSGKAEKTALAKSALAVVAPARRDPQARIVLDQAPATTISPDLVRAIPETLTTEDDPPQEEVTDHTGVLVHFRATDLDKTQTGWGAIIPSISERRVKLHMDPHIDRDKLSGHATIRADVTAVFSIDANGQRTPKLYFVRSIVAPTDRH